MKTVRGASLGLVVLLACGSQGSELPGSSTGGPGSSSEASEASSGLPSTTSGSTAGTEQTGTQGSESGTTGDALPDPDPSFTEDECCLLYTSD
ncbi:MAG: hypothetical protein KUG77_28985, partial [Nannocystaceae bacterium]|nr:hypothetical protein [Nannocystaceae bacterium]